MTVTGAGGGAVTVTGAGAGAVVVTVTVCLTVLVTGAAETVTALAVCAGEPQPAATPPKRTVAAIPPMMRIDLRMTRIPFDDVACGGQTDPPDTLAGQKFTPMSPTPALDLPAASP